MASRNSLSPCQPGSAPAVPYRGPNHRASVFAHRSSQSAPPSSCGSPSRADDRSFIVVALDSLQWNLRLVRGEKSFPAARRGRAGRRRWRAAIDRVEKRFGLPVGGPTLQLLPQLARSAWTVAVLEQRDRQVESIVRLPGSAFTAFEKYCTEAALCPRRPSTTPRLLFNLGQRQGEDRKLNAAKAFLSCHG